MQSHLDKIIQIPVDCVGFVMGKHGATIRDLREQSGCHAIFIDMEQANSGKSELCDTVLRGDPKAIAKAKRLVEQKVAEFRKPAKTMQIPTECIGLIMGRHGATVKTLKARSGCGIFIDLDAANHNPSRAAMCDVELRGDPDAVARAQQLIEEKLAESDQAFDCETRPQFDDDSGSTDESSIPDSVRSFVSSDSDFPQLSTGKESAAAAPAAGGLPPITEMERTNSQTSISLDDVSSELRRETSVQRVERLALERRQEEQKKLQAQAMEEQYSRHSDQHDAELVQTRSQLARENVQLKRKLGRQYSQVVTKVFMDAENCWIGPAKSCDDATFASQLYTQIQDIAKDNGGSGQLDWSLILNHDPSNRWHPSKKTLGALQDKKVDYLPVGPKADAVDTKFKNKIDDFIKLEKHNPGKYLVMLLAADKDYMSQLMELEQCNFKTVVFYNGDNAVSRIVKQQAALSGVLVDWSAVRAKAGGYHHDEELRNVPNPHHTRPTSAAFAAGPRPSLRPGGSMLRAGGLASSSSAAPLQQQPADVVIQIPSECSGVVIGRSGATVQDVKARSGCSWINVRDPAPGSVDVTRDVELRGRPSAIAEAQRLIEEKVKECLHFQKYHHNQVLDAVATGSPVCSVPVDGQPSPGYRPWEAYGANSNHTNGDDWSELRGGGGATARNTTNTRPKLNLEPRTIGVTQQPPAALGDVPIKMRSHAAPGSGYVPPAKRNQTALRSAVGDDHHDDAAALETTSSLKRTESLQRAQREEQEKKLKLQEMTRQSSAGLERMDVELSAVQGQLARERSIGNSNLPEPGSELEPVALVQSDSGGGARAALAKGLMRRGKAAAVSSVSAKTRLAADKTQKLLSRRPGRGGSSSNEDATAAVADVDMWLVEAGLSRYTDAIKDYGYDTMQMLKVASEEQINEMCADADMGMKKPHRQAFLVAWRALIGEDGGANGGKMQIEE